MTFDERMAQLQQELPDLRISGELECPFCGMYEILYIDRVKGVLVRTCRTCNYIQIIDLNNCSSQGLLIKDKLTG